MKTRSFLLVFCAVLLLGVLGGCYEFPPYEVTKPPFVNKTSLNMYVGDKVQLTASPVNASFTWTSDDEAVAKVDQTGLVEAVSEGLTSVFVASDNDRTKIDLTVKTFVPLTGIYPAGDTVELLVRGKYQVPIYTIPENASEIPIYEWVSDNPSIANVDNKGIITAGDVAGNTVITVSGGGFTKTITVIVTIPPVAPKMDKTGWIVTVFSDPGTPGIGKGAILDGITTISNYWALNNAAAWIIIDMQAPVEVSKIVTVRGQAWGNSHTKTLKYFIGNTNNPAGTWTPIATDAYTVAGGTGIIDDDTITLDIASGTIGQYLKLVLDDSFYSNWVQICEIDVYGY